MLMAAKPIGDLLREWRQRRHLSQLELACEADVSTKHVSFVETGRAQPSRDMVLHLAERLEVPLRERNVLLVAAGYAPIYTERPLADAALRPARQAVERVLAGHEPWPALAVDRHWTLVAANRALAPLIARVAPRLLAPPINVLRVSLHPEGLAPQILNLSEWRADMLARLRAQVEVTADPVLAALLEELRAYPTSGGNGAHKPRPEAETAGVIVPLQLASAEGVLNLISTTTVFGTPLDITLSELAVESFFPADAHTAEILGKRISTNFPLPP